MIGDNYYTNKLSFILNKSFELKTLCRGDFVLDKNTSLKLVAENFNRSDDKEQRIVNTFNYHVNKIIRPVFENQIFLGEFIYGISFSVVNILMNGDNYSKYFFSKIPDLLCDKLNIETNEVLTTSDYNKSKTFLEGYFVTKPTTGLITVESLTMESEVLEMHKRIYLNALSLTFESCTEIIKFWMTLYLNIVKCYEVELSKKMEKINTESNPLNISNETAVDEEFEDYYQSDSYEFENPTNSPYYDDNLDMDQQSLEFWENL